MVSAGTGNKPMLLKTATVVYINPKAPATIITRRRYLSLKSLTKLRPSKIASTTEFNEPKIAGSIHKPKATTAVKNPKTDRNPEAAQIIIAPIEAINTSINTVSFLIRSGVPNLLRTILSIKAKATENIKMKIIDPQPKE